MSVFVVDLSSSPWICFSDQGEQWLVPRATKLSERTQSRLEQCRTLAQPAASDWLVLMVPAGVSPEDANRLQTAASRAGWAGSVFVADSAPLLAAAHAQAEPADQTEWLVIRSAPSGVEASGISLRTASGIIHARIHKQRRLPDSHEALRCFNPKGRRIVVLDEPAIRTGGLFFQTARLLETVRTGRLALSLRRNGSMGLRRGVRGFLPLLDERTPITAGVRKIIEAPEQALSRLELWFGYRRTTLHPLRVLRLVGDRTASMPHKVDCMAEREMDGSVSVSVRWDGRESRVNCRFPIVML